jgi:hypothetical protein
MTLADADTTKLTVGPDGLVWCLAGCGLPRCSGWRADEAARRLGEGPFRVAGLRDNAALLLSLYQRGRCKTTTCTEVCSPLCCESAECRRDPEVLLLRMRSFNVPPSLGGWHRFGRKDVVSYLMACGIDHSGGVGPQVTMLLPSHPAWPALSFVQCLGRTAVCGLLAEVLDPRWYVDLGDPDRGAKLEQYLGLNPYDMSGQSAVKKRRRDLVQSCWCGHTVPRPHELTGPGQFLWRHWHARGGGAKGYLATSKLFVAYLRAVWANAVCDGPHAGHLFVPEHFFTTAEEAAAYRNHTVKTVPDG